MQQYAGIATAVYRRATLSNPEAPETPVYELPSWFWLLCLANIFVFLPLILFVQYTIRQIFPVLAIVENENPPAYEPVSLNDDSHSLADDSQNGVPKPAGSAGDYPSHTVTASMRGCHRILKASGGFRANFRGFFCLAAQAIMTWMLMGIFSAALGSGFSSVGTLLASLSLVQFSAAWVHIVISVQSPLRFWQRLPPFKRTFDATWKPVTMYWAAFEFTRWIPMVTGMLLGVSFEPKWTEDGNETQPKPADGFVWKMIIVGAVAVVCSILVMIPAHIVLVRVQASLLPEDTETIVPFDRSFEGTVEPAVVGGLGYVTVRDAWKTFSRSAWRRIVKLYIKIYAISLAFSMFLGVIIGIQFVVLVASSKEIEGGDNN
ncbi:hypothetical protein LIA77_07269 [Sarocladium implicatum]|nr:hypothetical protein LIA77_07269 [Sarocladium implicatum]